MLRFLSTEWLAERERMAAFAPVVVNFHCRVQHLVGFPDGEVHYFDVIRDGRLAASGLGDIESPDVTVRMNYTDEFALITGELDPVFGVSMGVIKIDGDQGSLLPVLPFLHAPEVVELRQRLAAATELPA